MEIHSTIAINFIFSRNVKEECLMHSNSDNVKFTPSRDENDVIDKLFKSLCTIYQENLETSMKASNFIFDSVQLLY